MEGTAPPSSRPAGDVGEETARTGLHKNCGGLLKIQEQSKIGQEKNEAMKITLTDLEGKLKDVGKENGELKKEKERLLKEIVAQRDKNNKFYVVWLEQKKT